MLIRIKFIIALACGFAAAMSGASAEQMPSQNRSGSVYGSFGQAAYVRGGALFAGHVTDDTFDTFGHSLTAGYRKPFKVNGRFAWSIQPEIAYFKDASRIDVAGFPVESTFWGLAGLISMHWAYDLDFVVPFASVGVGPLLLETDVSDGISAFEDNTIAVGYSGVAGFQTPITDVIAIEAAYRYLGATRAEVFGFHTAEIGVSYRF